MRLLSIAPLVLAACSSWVSVSGTNAPPHALSPRKATDVVVMHSAPAQPYVEVADLHFETDGTWQDGEMIPKLRDKAAELGCDVLWLPAGAQQHGICLVYKQGGAAAGDPTATGHF
jgi:hypothetical protein